MILVDLDRVGVSRPERPLFENLSLTISSGDRIGIVGLNGTGKSTLMRVMAGIDNPETGVVRFGKGVRIAMLEQRPELPDGTVGAAVGESWEADVVLEHLGMGPLATAPVTTLSGGQAKRVALARTLVAENDMLILDEPTNHLDIESITWLEDRLAAFKGGLVFVTHDRHVLDRVCTKVLELDRGAGYLYEGGYAAHLEARAERAAAAESAEATRRVLARKELAWLRRGAPARTRKPKAHIDRAVRIVEGRRQAAARATDRLSIDFGSARLGDKVFEADGFGFRYGAKPGEPQQPWLFKDLELIIGKGDRFGVVGPNGAGKTTLLELLAGHLHPQEGRLVTGPTVKIGYWDQHGVELDPAQKVRDAIAGPHRPANWEDDRLLERFWFDADARHAPIGLLSGGERRRLQLLLVLAAKPNVLLLDEPTNDLDVDTLRSLEDFLDDWQGTLIVVSHDRAFLERSVEDVLALDGAGRAAPVPGGYPAWVASRQRARPVAAGRASVSSSLSVARGEEAQEAPSPYLGEPKPQGPSPSTLRHRQRELDKAIQRLAKKQEKLVAELEAAGADHVALTSIGSDLAEVQTELADAEEAWLEVSEQLES